MKADSMIIKVSAILLAAGMSKRMGLDKLQFAYKSKTLLHHAVELLSLLPVYEKILVTTDTRSTRIDIPSDIILCINPQPEIGVNKSINIGLKAASGTHYLFLTADQPKLTVVDIMPILKTAENNPQNIVHPIINSKPCSPTLFPAAFRNDLLNLYDTSHKKKSDSGGRVIRDINQHLCLAVKPEYPMNFSDIDDDDDYKSGFGATCASVFNKSVSNFFVANRNGRQVFSFPVLILVIMILFFWVTIPLFIISLFFGFRYKFIGREFGKESVNSFMDSASDVVDDVKKSFTDSSNKNDDD